MDLKRMFFDEMRTKFEEIKEPLLKLMKNEHKVSDIEEVFRAFHTLKGSSGLVGFRNFQKVFHDLEDIVKGWKKGGVNEVLAARLSDVLDFLSAKSSDLSEEDVDSVKRILKGDSKENKTQELGSSQEVKEIIDYILGSVIEIETYLNYRDYESLNIGLSVLKKNLLEIYEELEYVPIEDVIKGFDVMVVRDAVELGKKAKLIADVEGAKVSRKDADTLRDILIHIVKNAVVHGIEPPNERTKKGKDPEGKIFIKSWIDGDYLKLEVSDDGAGIDEGKVLEKAERLNIPERDPYKIIFYPGFSSLDSANMKGGRGVGLDAVKSYLEERGGNITVSSERDRGTKFLITLPLEKYLTRLLVLKRSSKLFALDLSQVKSIQKADGIFEKNGVYYVKYEDSAYELKDLGEGAFNFVVITKNYAVAVDEIMGIREATIKTQKFYIDFIKGFAVGIETVPVPVIAPELISKTAQSERKKRRILVVDDSPLTRAVIKKLVENIGDIPITSVDVKSAIETINFQKFDCAVIDYSLPDGKGSEIVKVFREKFPNAKIIVLTAETDPGVDEDVKSSGADEIIRKGEPLERIIELLEG